MGTSVKIHCLVCGTPVKRSHSRSEQEKTFGCDMCGNVFRVDWGDSNTHGKHPISVELSGETFVKTVPVFISTNQIGKNTYHCIKCGDKLHEPKTPEETLYQCVNKTCGGEYEVDLQ
ncbi:hypothetical protein KC850_02760 [Candidatus Kaiserbacteria bacterium]|nr:hypothetical protein [Candidatus Kaiserbacteria bacterium]